MYLRIQNNSIYETCYYKHNIYAENKSVFVEKLRKLNINSIFEYTIKLHFFFT